MNESLFLGLVYNASLLLAMVLVFDLMTSKLKRTSSFLWKVVAGVVLGGIGLAVMLTNWELLPGIVFDTRSVLLGIIGLYFGGIPTLIAMAMTGAYRIYQGGSGVLMGVPVIIVSCLIGLVWRAFRVQSLYKLGWFELYIFGLIIHGAMLLCTLLLPVDTREIILNQIWFPVMTIYPVATLMLGAMMSLKLRRDYVSGELFESESKYKFLFDSMTQGVTIQDTEGKIVETNKAAETILGLSNDQLKGKTSFDPRWKMIKDNGEEFNPKETPSNIALRTGKAVNNVMMGIFVPETNCYHWILTSSIPRFKNNDKKPYSTLTVFTDITDRVKGEIYLKESENKFHGLFDSMIEGVAIHDVVFNENNKMINYRILDVNPSYKIQTGIKGEVKNKLATEVYKTDKPPYLIEYEKVLKTGKPTVFETYFEPLKRTFKVGVFVVKKNHFATVFEDVTEQHKTIQSLKESEEKFSQVFMHGPQIITISSLNNGTYLDVNNAFTEVLGFKKSEVIGKTVLSLNIWAENIDREKMIEDLMKNKVIRDREYKFRKKNGEIITCLCSMTTLTIAEKKYLLVLGINIEDRKKTEEKLAKVNMDILTEKHKLEAILRDMGDAVFVTDDKKKIILANKAMELLLGLKEKEIVGKDIEETLALSYEITGEKPLDLIENVFLKKKQTKPAETLVIKNKSGASVLVDGVASPIVGENMNLIGTVWILRDVSKEKELQKMRTDFISLASHQLRTPLTGIKWFVELLDENASKMPIDKVQEYIRKIGESNNRMIDLVNDLMTTSRADSGKLPKDVASYLVRDLLQQAIDEQGRIFLDKNIKIEGMELIPKDLEIDADMVQMVQVFGNLFNNAASYSPAGSRIEVGAESKLSKVKIFVRDHGMGIPMNQQNKVFSKFFRADNVAKTIPGSGLGLYVAKSMVENHGGKMWFESKENLGTSFFVELPIKQKNG